MQAEITRLKEKMKANGIEEPEEEPEVDTSAEEEEPKHKRRNRISGREYRMLFSKDNIQNYYCRRYVPADAMGMAKVRGKLEGEECRWCRNRVRDKHGERHHDVPRFGALLRDNTPSPACFFYINAPGYNNSSSYSGEGERRRGLALLLP